MTVNDLDVQTRQARGRSQINVMMGHDESLSTPTCLRREAQCPVGPYCANNGN
jgi:hypothetical protein